MKWLKEDYAKLQGTVEILADRIAAIDYYDPGWPIIIFKVVVLVFMWFVALEMYTTARNAW